MKHAKLPPAPEVYVNQPIHLDPFIVSELNVTPKFISLKTLSPSPLTVWYLPLKVSITGDGLTAESGLIINFTIELAHRLPYNSLITFITIIFYFINC